MADYTTVQKLQLAINKNTTGASDDVLARVITAVSRWIDRHCNRLDGFVALSTATARDFAGSGVGTQLIDECVAVSLVESKAAASDTTYTAWVAADWKAYSGDARVPDFNRTPFQALMTLPSGNYSYFPNGSGGQRIGFRPSLDSALLWGESVPMVRVTAKWGYAVAVPPEIEEACIIQATRQFKRGQSAFADAAGSDDFGVLQFRGLDPVVVSILKEGRYIRPRV